jgi:two-component system KDP operon response regulator KdpE
VQRVVRSLGIDVIEFGDVQLLDRPLEDLRGHRPSFVLLALDTIGPEQLAVLEQLRAITAVPIFVVSKSSTAEARIAAFEIGADEHVSHSVGPDELAARINAKLRRSRHGKA